MGQPVTSNPMVITLINMTVVFAVLWGLSIVVRLIRVADPTRKFKTAKDSSLQKKTADDSTETVSIIQADITNETMPAEDETIILIAAALAAYGINKARIVSVKPIRNPNWTQAARIKSILTSLKSL